MIMTQANINLEDSGTATVLNNDEKINNNNKQKEPLLNDSQLCSVRSIDSNKFNGEFGDSEKQSNNSLSMRADGHAHSFHSDDFEGDIVKQMRLQNVVNVFSGKPIDNRLEQEQFSMRIENQKTIFEPKKEKPKKQVPGGTFHLNYRKQQKVVTYDYRSLYCFHYQSKFRYGIVWFTEWKAFDYFIILLIACNSIMLAFQDFSDRVIQVELDDPNYQSQRNITINKAGMWFSIAFTIECMLKIIAMGFFMHKKAYLRDYWNWLDFIVVIVGMLELTPIPSADMKALRTLRVLRPLKSIKSFKSMRKLINSLLSSLKSLGNAVIFMFFIFLLFGILGVHQFKGLFYQRCRLTQEPVNGEWPIDFSVDRLCNTQYLACPNEQPCGTPLDKSLPLSIDKVYEQPLINYGIVTFDNLAIGLVTIFQMITLEGWTNIMYNLQDTESTKGMSVFFCVSLVFIGSFFLLNVILAVLSEALDAVDQADEAQKKEEKEQQRRESLVIKKPDNSKNEQSIDSQESSGSGSDNDVDKDQNPEKKLNTAVNDLTVEQPLNKDRNQVELQLIQSSNQNKDSQNSASVTPNEEFTNKQVTTKSGVLIPERAQRNCWYKFCFIVCSSDLFIFIITMLIIGNTFVLSLDRYPISQEANDTYNSINNILSWCFVAEMIIKLFGLGFKEYAKDQFNLFDAIIVVLSLIDMGIELAEIEFGTGGALSAFRGIRLLRVFKLARSWKSFRQLLAQIFITLKDITTFTVLLALFMFIQTLLGMELFAYDVVFNSDDEIVPIGTPNSYPPRENFNTFYNGLITIFVVFIGEDWNTVMYNHERATGVIAILFFVSLFIIGNLVLLNLFLAILLQNFEDVDGEKSPDESNKSQKKKKPGFLKKCTKAIKQKCRRCCYKCCSCCQKKPSTSSSLSTQLSQQQVSPNQKISLVASQSEQDSSSKKKSQEQNQNHSYLQHLNSNDDNNLVSQQVSQDHIEDQQHENVINITDQQQHIQPSQESQIDNVPGNQQDAHQPADSNLRMKSAIADSIDKSNVSMVSMSIDSNNPTLAGKLGAKKSKSVNLQRRKGRDIAALSIQQKQKMKFKTQMFKSGNNTDTNSQIIPWYWGQNMDICTMKKIELIEHKKQKKKDIVLDGNALCLLGPQNRFRRFCANIVSYPAFDNFILLMIIISTIMLTIESPLDDPNSQKIRTMGYIDIVMTCIFTMECLLKIITFGFLFNGSESYLRLAWNVNDFIIVTVSLISLMPSNDLDLGFFKVLRMLRVLRPLRMISRNPGLKIAVQSLINAIPGIGNLMVISMLVLLLFGILGTNFYKGMFADCDMQMVAPENVDLIIDKWSCFSYGGEWFTFPANFDNVGRAVITLFIVITTEGWTQIMWRAVDAAGIDMMPIRNNSEASTLFFIMFVIVGSLFILNLFVGVVIQTFNVEKEKLSHNSQLTPLQSELAEIQTNVYQLKPQAKYVSKGNKLVDLCHHLSDGNQCFDTFIFICIILNTICLSLKWYDRNPAEEAQTIATLTSILDVVNIIFTGIYTLEAFVKIVAMKLNYFKDGWNVFDFLIVIAAWSGILLNEVFDIDIGAGTTVIRSFRIARVLKIIKTFGDLRKFFLTFVEAIPELANVGGLLFLFMLLYAVLGVFLFSEVKLQVNGLTEHANFQKFSIAMLTLFRISTGEAWNDIMFDAARQKSVLFQCVESQTFEEIVMYGPQQCGKPVASFIFFPSFMIVVSFIFLNLFIAIILEGFSQQKQADVQRLQESDFEVFIKCWQTYDTLAKGMIHTDNMEDLLLDLVVEEFKLKKKMLTEGSEMPERIMFNLHKNSFLSSYTKEKRWEQLTDIIEPPTEEDIKNYKTYQKLYKREVSKFIGQLKIPTYNKIKNYNFYDTLISLVYYLFSYEYKQQKEQQELNESVSRELGEDDLTSVDKSKMTDVELEAYEQLKGGDFKNVINSFETKGMNKNLVILKLKELKEIRRKRGMKLKKQIDYLGNDIINSEQVQGARTIQRILLEKIQRRETIARNVALQKKNREKQQEMLRSINKDAEEADNEKFIADQQPYNSEQKNLVATQTSKFPLTDSITEVANEFKTESQNQTQKKPPKQMLDDIHTNVKKETDDVQAKLDDGQKMDDQEQNDINMDNLNQQLNQGDHDIQEKGRNQQLIFLTGGSKKKSGSLVSNHENIMIDKDQESYHSQLSKQLAEASKQEKFANQVKLKNNSISLDKSKKTMFGKINPISNIKNAASILPMPQQPIQNFSDENIQKLLQFNHKDNNIPEDGSSSMQIFDTLQNDSSDKRKLSVLQVQDIADQFSPILTPVHNVNTATNHHRKSSNNGWPNISKDDQQQQFTLSSNLSNVINPVVHVLDKGQRKSDLEETKQRVTGDKQIRYRDDGQISQEDDGDGGGGEAALQFSMSTNSIDSPINDSDVLVTRNAPRQNKESSNANNGVYNYKTNQEWKNLQNRFESRESLASQILNQDGISPFIAVNNNFIQNQEKQSPNMADKTNEEDDIFKNKVEINMQKQERRRSMVMEPPTGKEKPLVKSHRISNNFMNSNLGSSEKNQYQIPKPSGSNTIKLAGNQTLYGASYLRGPLPSHLDAMVASMATKNAQMPKTAHSASLVSQQKNNLSKGNEKDHNRDDNEH